MRTLGLLLGGLLGALAVMTFAVWFWIFRDPKRLSLPETYLNAAVPFAETIDPVLPTLVTALLALSVVKVGKFAPGFVVSTATLCGYLASTWSVLSVVAVAAPTQSGRSPANAAITAVGLGIVAVAVTVVLAEVLPLSSRVRDEQLNRALTRTAAALTTAQSNERRMMGRFPRPYSAAEAGWLVVAWYLLSIGLSLVLVLVALVVPTPRLPMTVVWAVSGSVCLMLLLILTSLHVAARFRLEATALRDEATTFVFFPILFAAGATALVIALVAVLNALLGGLFVFAWIPAIWAVVVLASGTLPLWLQLPKWGWLAQVVAVRGVHRLQKRGQRFREVQTAAVVDRAPEQVAPSVSASWLRRLLGCK